MEKEKRTDISERPNYIYAYDTGDIIRIALRQNDDSQTDLIPHDQQGVLPSSASAQTPFTPATLEVFLHGATDCLMHLYHLIINILTHTIIFVNS